MVAQALHVSDELKPCPFCGEKPDFYNKHILPVCMSCEWCGCEGPSVYEFNEEKAIEEWNKRYEPNSPNNTGTCKSVA